MTQIADSWVEVFKVGTQTDSEGRTHQVTSDFLDQVVTHYDPALHESPAVIGHPKDNAPAYGWVNGLRVIDGILQVQFKDVDPSFEQIVQRGYFKKRSASFYVDPATAPGGRAPYLRHVGFLGAQPPAVKGLRDIKFTEGESLSFEASTNFSEVETMLDDKQQDSLITKFMEALKSVIPGLGKREEGVQASFSEKEITTMIADAVKGATASFGERITELADENKNLRSMVEQQGSTASRADLTNFVEKLGAARVPEPLRAGLVDFMDAISGTDRKITVVSFAEEGGNKVEKKTEYSALSFFKNFLEQLGPFIEFGERFSGMRATGSDTGAADPTEVAELRKQAGLPASQGGK
jgi:hypothetical protein